MHIAAEIDTEVVQVTVDYDEDSLPFCFGTTHIQHLCNTDIDKMETCLTRQNLTQMRRQNSHQTKSCGEARGEEFGNHRTNGTFGAHIQLPTGKKYINTAFLYELKFDVKTDVGHI